MDTEIPNITIETTSNERRDYLNDKFKKIYRFGFKDEFRILFLSSIPLIFNNFSQTFLPIISLFFCGHIGSNELAAVTLANTFINIGSFSTLVGLSSACDTLLPQLYGGVDKKKVGLVLQKGLIISLLSCLPTSGVLLNVKHLINSFIEDKIIVELADKYTVIYLPAIIFYSIHVVLQKYLLSQNIFYPILFINLIANILNVLCHVLFVYFLKMSVAGAAISVVTANVAILLFVLIYIYYTKIYELTWSGWSIDCLFNWTEYLKLAIPGFAMLFFGLANFEIGVITAGKLGSVGISVMSIGIQTTYIAFMIPLGIATSANIRVGQLLGENAPEMAKNSCKVAFTISYLASIITCGFIFAGSKLIPLAFTTDDKIVSISSGLLKLLAFVHIMDATQGFGGGVLRAIGAQFYGFMMVLISFYVIGIPVGTALLLKTDFKVTGYWIGYLVGAVVLITMQAIFIFNINWKDIAQEAYNRSLKSNMEPKKENAILLSNIQEASITTPLISYGKRRTSRIIFQKFLIFFILLVIFALFFMIRVLIKTDEPRIFQMQQEQILFNATSTTTTTTTTTTRRWRLLSVLLRVH